MIPNRLTPYRFSTSLVAALLCLYGLVGPAYAATELETLIVEAQEQLQAGDAEAAYGLLAEQQSSHAGEPEYDYWLGFMAVRAGKPSRGIFALERVLLVQPNHAAARIELAHAYLQLGQKESAAKELDQLEQMNPPEQAQKRLEQLRQQVGRQQTLEEKRKSLGFITIEGGKSDNVGTWPEGALNALPGAPRIKPLDSEFGGAQAGYRHQFELSSTQYLELSLAGSVRRHQYQPARQFDQDFYRAGLDWVHDLDGRNEILVGASSDNLRLDDVTYYRQAQVRTEWRHQLNQSRKTRVGLSHQNANYDLRLYDYDSGRIWFGLDNRLSRQVNWNLELTAEYAGAGRRRPGGDSKHYTFSSEWSYRFHPKHAVSLDLAWIKASYQHIYPMFSVFNLKPEYRRDEGPMASLQWAWFMTDMWQLRARAQFRKQHSTLDVYNYEQTQGTLALTRYF